MATAGATAVKRSTRTSGASRPRATKATRPRSSRTSTNGSTGSTDPQQFICNVVPSKGTETDWSLQDALAVGALGVALAPPKSVDLRETWWSINNQEDTGSCVGWATADGLVRYVLTKAGKISETDLLSPRHVWMASKETDEITNRPETFIEEAGTTLKAAVDVARKTGVSLMSQLPFHIATAMYKGPENQFYASCSTRKVAAYFNLRKDLKRWKQALAGGSPILAALHVDASWDDASDHGGKIDTFKPNTVRGGHAICIVGYRTDGRFIVRNSWGTNWGDKGFGYLKPSYIAAAFFDESYSVSV